MAHEPRNSLGPLEHRVMEVIWATGPSTADQIRQALAADTDLKDSTVRTILRRLEEKGYLTHTVQDRTFVYSELVAPQSAALRAVRHIIDRFCGGSVENLLVGMVDGDMLDERQLTALAEKIAAKPPKPGAPHE
jgi:BlaI family transcriptional regulator, penicillinase repressor